jgi:hypothetical protein
MYYSVLSTGFFGFSYIIITALVNVREALLKSQGNRTWSGGHPSVDRGTSGGVT